MGLPLFSSGVCAPRRLAKKNSNAGGRLNIEFDALRQWQFLRPIRRHGLPPHVSLPGVAARFAPAARVFLAAERPSDFRPAGADVDIRNPTVAATRAQECFS